MSTETADVLVLENKTNFALIKFIESEGLNQSTFGEKVGVQRATVNGWVRQGKQPSPATLAKISTCFNRNPEDMNILLGFNVDLQDYKGDTVPLRVQVRGLQVQVAALTQIVQDLMTA